LKMPVETEAGSAGKQPAKSLPPRKRGDRPAGAHRYDDLMWGRNPPHQTRLLIRKSSDDRPHDASEQVLGGTLRVILEIQSEGDAFELDPRLQDYFSNRIGLSGDQIGIVTGFSRRIASYLQNPDRERDEGKRGITVEGMYNRSGISSEMLNRIKTALNRRGIETNDDFMRGFLRVFIEMREEGEEFELDPKLRNHYENVLKLTDEQIDLVIGLSRRISLGGNKR